MRVGPIESFRIDAAFALRVALVSTSLVLWAFCADASEAAKPLDIAYPHYPSAPLSQSNAKAAEKSASCMACHTRTDQPTMHASPAVVLGCTDCHGGNAAIEVPPDLKRDSTAYRDALRAAHVLPRYPQAWHWPSSRLPERTYTLLNREAPEFIRFVNPGDLRVARESCGACHASIIDAVERSMMASGAMLWGGASYNNGILDFKRYILGEAYTRDGIPAMVPGLPGDDTPEALAAGRMSMMLPLPRWETVPPADNFRVFERGGRNIQSLFPEVGLPNPLEEPGRPDIRQSNRGPGTGSRISLPVLNLHKTRLNDPNLWFMGTADQPGDFRASGCTGCHSIYANDRDPLHSGPAAEHGNWGTSVTVDPTISHTERGHPLRHEFTRAIPSSQCMVCHMHQPNMFLNSYLGYTMWDYEADAPLMWPEKQRRPTSSEIHDALERNPEGAVVRGKWSDVEFLARVAEDVNPKAQITQFADYHGHGWNFRAVFKRDREGRMLDADDRAVAHDDPKKFEKAVHLRDIHAERGMHCVDCHFGQDAHGDGHMVGEVAAGVEIRCRDCHGTVDGRASLVTSGPAAADGGRDLSTLRNPDGERRFQWRGGRLYQRSLVWPDKQWRVPQVRDSVTKGHPDYNSKAARAKTMRRGADLKWGGTPEADARAHGDDEMACFTCHSSWVTSCAGCHLPVEANRKTESHHYEGGETRNYATYNPQVARDQMFLIGRHGEVKGGIIAPLRSSSALIASSTDINRNHVYVQQPPVASSGFSSQAFNPHFPHTVRGAETKTCDDCHVSERDDNNAILAQLVGVGTNFVNFVGFNAWVGTERSIEAVQVTQWEEPQAVIGSYLHRYAYPDEYARHIAGGKELRGRDAGKSAQRHDSNDARCLQLRGEYLYVAEGDEGMQAYDVANVANKFYSQPIVSSPFSLFGQRTRVKTENATCVALPTNQPIRPDRRGEPGSDRDRFMTDVNLEQPMHPIYRYAAITDSVEGLILTDVTTLGDFEPRNNFFDRDLVWNPDGLLDGASYAVFAGHILYVAATAGVVVVDLEDPLAPVHRATIPIVNARGLAVQLRYLFVVDDEGLKVVDVTRPERPVVRRDAVVPLADAHRVFVARTYAYVAAGGEGLAIIDVTRPSEPKLVESFTAEGAIQDARDVVVATTNASLFAYIADGEGGLKVVQLTSPDSQPHLYGFSPRPHPELIAHHDTVAPALALSRGLERDRAVDETGHQVAVFGRVGSRPFTLAEMRKLFLDERGEVWTVPSRYADD